MKADLAPNIVPNSHLYMNRFFTSYQDYPLDSISEIITLLPIIVGLFRFRYLKVSAKFLLVFFLLHFARDIISNAYASLGQNNIFVYNYFSYLEIGMTWVIFYTTPADSITYKRSITIGLIIALLVSGFFYENDEFSVANYVIVRLYGLSILLPFFYLMLAESRVKNILHYPMFWFSTGFLLYLCGTFFIFLFGKEVLSIDTDHVIFDQYWQVVLLFYIVFCLCCSTGIWFSKQDQDNLT